MTSHLEGGALNLGLPRATLENHQISSLPEKSEKVTPGSPKVTKMISKPPPEHQFTEKVGKVKPLKNHNTYYGLNTYSHRNPVTFHPQITKKSTLEPVLQLCYPKYEITKVTPKWVPRGSQNPSKID